MKDGLDSLIGQMAETGVFFKDAVGLLEIGFLKRVLEITGGNQLKAAEILGIHRNTLRRKIQEYRLGQNSSPVSEKKQTTKTKKRGRELRPA